MSNAVAASRPSTAERAVGPSVALGHEALPRDLQWLCQPGGRDPQTKQVAIEPFLQLGSTLARRKKLTSKSDSSKREDARVKIGGVGCSSHCLTRGFGSPLRLNSERTFVSSRNPLIGQLGVRSLFVSPGLGRRQRVEIPSGTAPSSSAAQKTGAFAPFLARRPKRDRGPRRDSGSCRSRSRL
jgi:hypothetical protein